MSDQPISDAGRRARGRSVWRARLPLGFEFALLFAAAFWMIHKVLPGLTVAYPNPLWIPVIVLSLQHGLGLGIAAAAAATGFYVWDGLPTAVLSEDFYQYIGRVAAEPVGWTAVALLFGHIRHRQIEERSGLKAELAEQNDHCIAVADHCEDLKRRTEMLERHIAANVQASHVDIAEAITGLHEANWDNFPERLTRFIQVMTGATEFSLYLMRDERLSLAFQPRDEAAMPVDATIKHEDTLFIAVVKERKVLSATRPADRDILDGRGVLVGPLIEHRPANRVIGMLRIGGADLVDFPEDIERRFALTRSEIARLLDRAILIDSAPPPPAPASRPVGRLEQLHAIVRRQPDDKKKSFDPVAG